jgi:hypothetical protein
MSYTLIYRDTKPCPGRPGKISYFKKWWLNYAEAYKSTVKRNENLISLGCVWKTTNTNGILTFETEEDATAFVLRWS